MLDRATARRGTFTGTLQVTPGPAEPDQLRWHEAGELTWDGRRQGAYRTLGLHHVGAAWWMTFADGRPFHRWVVGEPVEHPCGADIYRGLIESSHPAELRITWDVTGPTKDQLIVSRLSRLVG